MEFHHTQAVIFECVWVRGVVKCNRNPDKQLNVEVRVYDRDGFSIFKVLDPDDLMGVTFTEPDGTFQLDGCGDDFNWLPGVANNPDPYIKIHHYCNSEKGETIEMPEFNTFVPETYDIGIIELDSNDNKDSKTVLHKENEDATSKAIERMFNKVRGERQKVKAKEEQREKEKYTVTQPDLTTQKQAGESEEIVLKGDNSEQ
uniref:Uncharacterized protein n=1 Tax=Ditylenchus dipsaci TaxID=166011 RepID=A0A915CUK3_9BILA